MRTVICYASKTGTTEKCAKKLQKLLKEADLCNIEKQKLDLSLYECIIVGGSIRMGHLHKAAKNFIKSNKSILLEKKTAFFICNGFPEQAESFLMQNIDKELLEQAVCAASFGGEVDLTKMKGMDKFIAKAVMNSLKNNPEATPKVNEESIKEFAEILLGV